MNFLSSSEKPSTQASGAPPKQRSWWKPTRLNKALAALWCGALLRKGPLCCTTHCSCFNDIESPEAQRARAEEARWKYRSDKLADRKESRAQAAERRAARQSAKQERRSSRREHKSARRSAKAASRRSKSDGHSTPAATPSTPPQQQTHAAAQSPPAAAPMTTKENVKTAASLSRDVFPLPLSSTPLSNHSPQDTLVNSPSVTERTAEEMSTAPSFSAPSVNTTTTTTTAADAVTAPSLSSSTSRQARLSARRQAKRERREKKKEKKADRRSSRRQSQKSALSKVDEV